VTGECVQHYYINTSFFVQSARSHHTPTIPDKLMIKRLEKITINDYPPEVQAHVKQLRLGEEALTDDLPAQFKTEHMQTFEN